MNLTSVPPDAVERELNNLWRAAAEARRAAGNAKPLARTRLLTLLTFAPDLASAALAETIITQLAPHQPLRSILLVADENAPENLEAAVTLLGADTSFYGEHIRLVAHGPSVLDLPSTTLALLLPNVPAFLWWMQGNPFAHPILEPLLPGLERLVLDTLALSQLDDVTTALDDVHFPVILSDLSWARLAPWRYLTAQLFDPPALRPQLELLTEVHITHNAPTPRLAQLFASWLAARLGWQPEQWTGDTWHFAKGQTITFNAQAAPELPASQLSAVNLQTAAGAAFSVTASPNQCAALSVTADDQHMAAVLPLRMDPLATVLGHELNRLNRSAVWEAAVKLLGSRD